MSPTLIIGIVLVYFLLLLAVGFITGQKSDNQSFFIGNRKSPWLVVAYGMIGASLSGITFISVPGWVLTSKFAYMQMVLGYLLGYIVIAFVLIPLYYKLNVTSIYTYLEKRFGLYAYKTGALFFLISRLIGASFRLFIVTGILQFIALDKLGIPFPVTVLITIFLIWIYTYRGGIKTIVWTDTLQTTFMLLSVVATIWIISFQMKWSFSEMITQIKLSEYSKIFFFDDWHNKHFFIKQFISGIFITIVMTGLDQDMMQKNLSCRNKKDAQKNVLMLSGSLVIVNIIFLSLGVLLVLYAKSTGLPLPQDSDQLFPMIVMSGLLPPVIILFFIIGLIAAAFSSADSALTALTTSFTIDILPTRQLNEQQLKRQRFFVHVLLSITLLIIIIVFQHIKNGNVISNLFKAAGYTYGPLLGLFSFGLFHKQKIYDKAIPFFAVISPILTYIIGFLVEEYLQYQLSFELLIVNGLIMYLFLWLLRKKA
ncbi:MAG TPA: sodium:solute symporter [Bacteroidales bacterium]|nr:sodium:solute symporter [Bacteroidales bacterium]